MEVHFIDVGFGTMVLILLPEGSIFMYDCNITDQNEYGILTYLDQVIGDDTPIDVFINSHRDADHTRGIKKLHAEHTIEKLWDTGVPGTTPDSPEYQAYMELRRSITTKEIEARKFWVYGDTILRCMNAKWKEYTDANEQSVVLKIEYKGSSVMLAGDTNYRPWKEKILPYYSDTKIKSDILLASHHGSLSFFDDPSDSKNYFVNHIKKINPAMTLISVGPNKHKLPNEMAIKLYKKYSRGSKQGNKVYTTEDKENMRLILKDDGGWTLKVNQ